MRKINWGVMGTAYICERDTLPGMLMADNCRLYAIAGRNPEKAEDFKTRYGFEKAYYGYQELLEDPEVEAVYIPLPNTMHHEWTIKALQHGKHVLCEKPMAPTAEQAAEMFAAARENGVFLMEAFAYLHSPFVAAVKKELEQGAIGDVLYMNVHFLTSDYDVSNIRMRKETLGGSMYDIGVYASSLIQTMLGTDPQRIQAFSSFDANHIDKLTTVLADYADGRKAILTTGMVMATEKNKSSDRFEIQGTEGTLRSVKFGFNGCGKLSYRIDLFDGTSQEKEIDVPNNYMLEVEQLGRCILAGESPAVTETMTMANAKLVDAVLKAIQY